MRDRLAANFTAHAERTQARIAMIEETDPTLAAELSAKFEASLSAHEAILAQTDDVATAPVQVAVRNTLNVGIGGSIAMDESADHSSGARVATFAMVQEDTAMQKTSVAAPAPTQSASDAVSAKRMYAAAEKSLRSANELYKKAKVKLDAETKVRVEAFLEATTEVFAEGERQYTNAMYGEAFTSFQETLRRGTHLAVYLKAYISGDIDSARFPLPLTEDFPVLINLPHGAVDPIRTPEGVEGYEVRPHTDTEQIDSPSLELDSGPEDTPTDDSNNSTEINTRTNIEVRL